MSVINPTKTETVNCGFVSFGSDGGPIKVSWTEQRPVGWFDDAVSWVASQPTPDVIVVGPFFRNLVKNGEA